jgi:hypothetical protein
VELQSFREILLKKAEGDPRLELLVEYVHQDRLADAVIESLRKMARLTHHAARNPNSALFHFASNMNEGDVHQIRDALGHHISHYRGALKTMHAAKDPTEKQSARTAADMHLNKIVPLAHLAAKAAHHSGGMIDADLPPIRPWEANYTGAGANHKFSTTLPKDDKGRVHQLDPLTNRERKGRPGVEFEGTQGWNRRITSRPKDHKQDESRGVHDYRYLEMPPHGAHEALSETHHRGGFPFEEIRVGSGPEVASGGGHLPIEDVGEVKQFVPHEFDSHPIHNVFDMPDKALADEPNRLENFVNAHKDWESTPKFQDWLSRYGQAHEANPDRGLSKPSHVFEGIPLQDQPKHVKEAVDQSNTQSASPDVPMAAEPVESTPKSQKVLKRPAKKSTEEEAWNSLNDDEKKTLAHLFPKQSGKV